MKKLVKYVSPFAPDQSGACGVLYELGGLLVICDAGGCAGNICGFDEPRWLSRKSAVFSAGLRDMDAILGRDDKLIEKLRLATLQIDVSFTAIIGTPVPAVIATDFRALRRMAEKATGLKCISVPCTGTEYYDVGEEKAWSEIFAAFAVEKYPVKNGRTGIIGATPLEASMLSSDSIMSECIKRGISEPVCYGLGSGLENIEKASESEKNLVISLSGIKAAEYLKEKFGTPYEVGFPFVPDKITEKAGAVKNKKVLIIHSQLIANSLRDRMDKSNTVDCCTFFMQKPEYSRECDKIIADEDMLFDIVGSGGYDTVIADGCLKRAFSAAGFEGEYIDFPHFAVSGSLWE